MSSPDAEHVRTKRARTESELPAAASSQEPKKAPGISEVDVGIVEYVSAATPGFSGVLKQRYTDFQVNEIDLEGKVVHLCDLGPETLSKPVKTESTEDVAKVDQEKPGAPDITAFSNALDALIGKEAVIKCVELFKTGSKYEDQTTYDDKDVRTQIHQLVKKAFLGRVETSTTKDNKICFRLASEQTRDNRLAGKFGKALKFLRFTMYKENKETMEVASLIAKLLRIQPRAISFAGTKDRRGITTQRFCVQQMSIPRMTSLNNALRGIRIGDFHYHKEPLRLGDLEGNQFYIAIRDVDGEDEAIEKALQALRVDGFINYFGLQRFGTFSISTHHVGRSILSGDFDSAVASILEPQDVTLPESREAREIWKETRDAALALEHMPRRCVAEYHLLQALRDSPSSINALLRVPRNLRVMYVHAYQSYIWNLAASERIKHGTQVKAGDLVDAGFEGGFQRARALTDADIATGAFSMYNILLPVPGFDVIYPSNLEQFYESVMGHDGIDCHKMRRNIKEFSLSGGYRKLLSKPSQLDWWITSYEDDKEQLIFTDLDILQTKGGQFTAETSAHLAFQAAPGNHDSRHTKKAVVLRMNLGTSQYATMALREAMKADTNRHGSMFFA